MIESSPLTLESMKDELADIKAAMSKSEDSIVQKLVPIVTNAFKNANADLLNMIEKKIDIVKAVVEEGRRTTQKISTIVDQLVVSCTEMQERINQLEQEKLNNSMEISGISSDLITPSTSLKNLASNLLKSYNIEHSIDSLVSVHTKDVKIKNETSKLLIVTLPSYAEKSRMMRIKRQNEKESPVKIFFGHVLTHRNRYLFMRARRVAKPMGIQVYVAHGRVYMKNPGDLRGSLIKSHDDVDHLEQSKGLVAKNQPAIQSPTGQRNNVP